MQHRQPNSLEIERAFKDLNQRVVTSKRTTTSCEDVLRYMYEHPDQIWFMSWDFVGQSTRDGKFLSHRAPARASDLAIFDSQLVEDRRIGRFKAYRLRTENLHLIQKRLGIGVTAKPKPLEEKCIHGLPTYVACPNCKNKPNHYQIYQS